MADGGFRAYELGAPIELERRVRIHVELDTRLKRDKTRVRIKAERNGTGLIRCFAVAFGPPGKSSS